MDPKQIEFDHFDYYQYMGSLTTPLYTEDVTWTVIMKIFFYKGDKHRPTTGYQGIDKYEGAPVTVV